MAPSTQAESSKSMTIPTDAQYALNGVYTLMRNYEYYGARMTYYGDVKGDDMQSNGDSKRVAKYYLFTFEKEDAPSSFWTYPYTVIRNVNNILEYTNKFTDAELTEELKSIKGQALTIRAMAHFDLVKIYGLPYSKDNGASLGVPIMTEKPAYNEKPARNTVKEVYDQIQKDLIEASDLLPVTKNNGKLNWFGARLLLARAYLYMDKNTEAYDVASDLITKAEANKYTLWTNTEYTGVWAKEHTSEIFFQLVVKADEVSSSNEFIGYLLYASGYDDAVPTSSFIDFMKEDPDDVRNKLLSYNSSKKKTYLIKYPGNTSDSETNPGYSDIPILRLSEVYLIAAEAAQKKGDNTNALKYLNAIAKRANSANEITGTVTLDKILDERRKELIGEGHRFFDAMRNNKRIERTGDSHSTSKILSEAAKSFDWDWYKIVLPIPRSEINTNPNIVQNPGY
jgi:hypothetical protein